MALRNENEWTEFLESAGITDGTILTTYSKAFTDNGFNEHSLTVLDKESLTAIGVTLMLGHQLAILKFAAERQQVDLCSTHHNESFRHSYVKYRVIQ